MRVVRDILRSSSGDCRYQLPLPARPYLPCVTLKDAQLRAGGGIKQTHHWLVTASHDQLPIGSEAPTAGHLFETVEAPNDLVRPGAVDLDLLKK